MTIDHIGIAVRSIEDGMGLWMNIFGYTQATEPIVNTRQKVRVVFLEKSGSVPVKLIEPSDQESPLNRFVGRGGGLHHLCFKCEDMAEDLEKMRSLGLRVITEPEPGEAFENHPIAFVYAGQGLNIELIDTLCRAGRLVDGTKE